MLIKLVKSYICIRPKGPSCIQEVEKLQCYYVRPLAIYKAIGPNQFLLMSLYGVVYPQLVKETRLKPGVIWTTKGNVYTLAQIRQVLSTGVRIAAQGS